MQPVAVVRGHRVMESEIPAFLGAAFAEVLGILADQGLAPAGPPFARYAMADGGFDVEAGFPATRPVKPAGRVDGYVAAEPPWECYLDGPEVAEPRTAAYLPCRPS